MPVTAIVFACIAFAAAFVLIPLRLVASPCCAFLGLLILSMGRTDHDLPILPLDSALIFGWLCVTILVAVATLLQPVAVRNSNKGIWYLTGGALVGLAVGLLGFTFSSLVSAMYAVMIIAVAAGTILGFLSYTRTPDGKVVAPGTGRFFSYLMAKGFPIAITMMQAGVVIVLLIAIHNFSNPS